MAERYEIVRRLGRGGVGAVYVANDLKLGREVAIKRLLPIEQTHLNAQFTNEQLKKEAQALAAFSHPNIVTVYEFGEDEEGPYVVTEFVDGETLKEIVEQGALAESDFIKIANQCLDALASAQELTLLHRDLKPANIMLAWLPTEKFQIKILDFGLAKFSQTPSKQTRDQTGSFLGSVNYIAPEQLELKPLDQRTDLYSLGCVLYYSLTQLPPFEAESVALTTYNHLEHNVTHLYELRPDMHPPLTAWVMQLIQRDPNERPANALQASEWLKNALDAEAVIYEDG